MESSAMDSERWQNVERLYHAAMEREESQRAAFLAGACGGDEALLHEVESLVSYGGRSGKFIEGSALELVAPALAEDESDGIDPAEDEDHISANMIGKQIAQYQIVDQLGQGGMGEVYRAVRADGQYQKQVAIKLVRAGQDSRSVINRFKNERQILAGLDHPNIARLIDGGATDEGVPYFVMELVEGQPIDKYCDSHKLAIPARLKLFLQVCSALQCAHQRQIIHRDIKPSNILVTAEGVPKLLDFGIAKILDSDVLPRVAGAVALTQTFRAFTPKYASPEQIKGDPITAASDVYSLGVLLYELLTGHRPYRFKTPTPAEIEKVICEEEPLKPSTVVTRVEEEILADGTTSSITPEEISGAQDSDPKQMRGCLLGDLDAIVMMALRKEPHRRYASVHDFSEDIRKHLEGLPITARPSTIWYRGAKFVRRHRELTLSALIFLVLLSSLSIWEARRASIQRSERQISSSRPNLRRSVAVLGFKNLSGRPDAAWLSTALSEMLTTELAAGERLRTVPGEDVAHTKIDLSLSDEDSLGKETLARLHKTLGTDFVVLGSYFDLGKAAQGQIRLDLRLQDTAAGETIVSISETGSEVQLLDLVSRTGEQLRWKLGVGAVSPAEVAGVRASLPSNPEATRFYSEGLAKLRVFDFLGARASLQKAVAADPNFALAHAALAEAWSNLGYDPKATDEAKKATDLSGNLGREDRLAIEGRYRTINHENDKALEIYKSLFTFFPDNLDYGLHLIDAQFEMGNVKDSLATLGLLRKLPLPLGEDPRIDLAEALLAAFSAPLEKPTAAARAAAKGIELGERLVVAKARAREGHQWALLGQPDRGLALSEDARAIYEAVGDRYEAGFTNVEIAQTYYTLGNFVAAKRSAQEALVVAREIGSYELLTSSLNGLGNILRSEGDLVAARTAYKESLDTARELNPKMWKDRIVSLDHLAEIEFAQGNLSGAMQLWGQLLALSQEAGGQEGSGRALTGMGDILFAKADLPRARQRYTEGLRLLTQMGWRYKIAKGQLLLASLSIEEGHPAEVEGTVRQAREQFQSQKSEDGQILATAVLVRALLAQGKFPEAQKELDDSAAVAAHLQYRCTALDYAIADAQTRAAMGKAADAKQELESTLEQTRKYGFVPEQFEARLALGEIQMKSGESAAGRAILAALEKDAKAKGFLLIAHKAASAIR
jgi:serine/threonine-protein kinase